MPDAGVVDQDIDRAVALESALHHAAARLSW